MNVRSEIDDLIKALQICAKYMAPEDSATWTAHDELHVGAEVERISADDLEALDDLGFIPNEWGCLVSFRYGSA